MGKDLIFAALVLAVMLAWAFGLKYAGMTFTEKL